VEEHKMIVTLERESKEREEARGEEEKWLEVPI
jgi:hypothetical protein